MSSPGLLLERIVLDEVDGVGDVLVVERVEELCIDVGTFVMADAARMRNQVTGCHGPLLLGIAGTVFLDGDVEIELVLLGELERGRGRHCLADGGCAVGGVVRGLDVILDIGESETF